MNAITHCWCHYCFCHGFQGLCLVLGYVEYFDGALEVIKDFIWFCLELNFSTSFQHHDHIVLCEKIVFQKTEVRNDPLYFKTKKDFAVF